MKNLFKSVVAIAALSVPSLALASSWEIDSTHSSANFSVKHMMMTNVKGEFAKVTGNVTLVIHKDGNWEMDSYAKNKLIAWRNVTFRCTIRYDAPHREIELGIPRYRVMRFQKRGLWPAPVADLSVGVWRRTDVKRAIDKLKRDGLLDSRTRR